MERDQREGRVHMLGTDCGNRAGIPFWIRNSLDDLGEARPPRLALARLAAAVAVAACWCFIDAASASSDDDSAGDSTLFACGSNGDASADTKQVIGVFDAVKSVCCDDFLEECDSSSTLRSPAARLDALGSCISSRSRAQPPLRMGSSGRRSSRSSARS